MVDAVAAFAARRDKFACVIAVAATDDDDQVGLLRQFNRSVLSLFCRLANGVDEANFGIGKAVANQADEMAYLVEWLSGLRGNAKTRVLRKFLNVFLGQYNIEVFQILC